MPKPTTQVDPELIANLDLIETMDILENSEDWDAVENLDDAEITPEVSDVNNKDNL